MKKKNNYPQKDYIIAEVGTNHNRNYKKFNKIVDKILNSNVDAIKFQIYEPTEIVNSMVNAKDYALDNLYGDISAIRMFDKYLKTPKKWIEKNFTRIKKKKNIGVTIHGQNGLNWSKKYNFDFIKIASMDHNNFPFLKNLINNVKAPIILSLGMVAKSDIQPINKILKKHKFGYSLMYCSSLYPPKQKDLKFANINFLKKRYKIKIGFSDHTKGSQEALRAKMYGADFFEKHVTLNNNDIGPDHKFACELGKKFNTYINQIKSKKIKLKKITLNKNYVINKKEQEKRTSYLKSIHCKNNIEKNTILRKKDILISRPGNSLEPKFLNLILNKKTKKKLQKFEQLKIDYFKIN